MNPPHQDIGGVPRITIVIFADQWTLAFKTFNGTNRWEDESLSHIRGLETFYRLTEY